MLGCWQDNGLPPREVLWENIAQATLDALQEIFPGYVFRPESFTLDSAIDRLVALALKQTHNNVAAAARLMGMTRDQLRYRLKMALQNRPEVSR
jgi:transcriptional regulator with AAA-type ATPase domain